MAVGDFTTLDQVKKWLNIQSADTDDLLRTLITSASKAMRRYMERDIVVNTYTDRRSGVGMSTMMMKNFPIVSVSSLTVNGQSVPAAAGWGSPGFFFDDAMVYLANYSFTRGKGNVVVTYQAGYAEVPDDLAQACVDVIGMRWRERERIGLSSKGLAGETTAFNLKDFPSQVITLMDSYKKVVPV